MQLAIKGYISENDIYTQVTNVPNGPFSFFLKISLLSVVSGAWI